MHFSHLFSLFHYLPYALLLLLPLLDTLSRLSTRIFLQPSVQVHTQQTRSEPNPTLRLQITHPLQGQGIRKDGQFESDAASEWAGVD